MYLNGVVLHGEYISGKHVALYADIDGHYIIDNKENVHFCAQHGMYNAAVRVYHKQLIGAVHIKPNSCYM